MEIPAVCALLPHSGPMVLLDRVVAVDEESLSAEVTIKLGDMFCDSAGVGAWVGIEYMAQAIGAYAGYVARLCGAPIRLGFLLGTRRYDCNRPRFSVGSVLRVSVKRTFQGENGLASFECEIEDVAHGPAAKATLTVFQPPDSEAFLRGNLSSK
jgi:predicted hotdog family 3-hydroxylacyl-ACP dehydratase